MPRVLIVVAVVVVAFSVFTLIDLLMTDRSRVRALNKPLWALIVVLLPAIGGILWLWLGKDRRTSSGGSRRTVAPDDDPSFLQNIARDREQEERIRRLEQELADLDDDPNKNPKD